MKMDGRTRHAVKSLVDRAVRERAQERRRRQDVEGRGLDRTLAYIFEDLEAPSGRQRPHVRTDGTWMAQCRTPTFEIGGAE